MITLAEANVKFKSEGADKVKKDSSDIASAVSGMAGKIGVATTVADLAAQSILALGAAIANVSKFAFDQAVQFDSNIRSLAAYSASSSDLSAQIARLEQLAKAPGLGFDQLVQGVTRLEAAGFSAKQAEDALKQFGNALALVGGSKNDLDGVALALTQIKSKGVVSAEEINQIAERVPQVRVAMKAAFGTASTEEIQKLGITATEFVTKLTKEMAKLPRATGGLQNALDNIDDAFKKAGRTVGTGFFALFEQGPPIFNQLSSSLQNVAEFISSVFTTIAESEVFKQIQRNISSIIDSFKTLSPVFEFVFKGLAAIALGTIKYITDQVAIFARFFALLFKDPIAFIKNEFFTMGEQIKVFFNNLLGAILDKIRGIVKSFDSIAKTDFAKRIPVVTQMKMPEMTPGQKAIKAAMEMMSGKGAMQVLKNSATAFGQIYDLKPAKDPTKGINVGGPRKPSDDAAIAKDKDDKDKKKKQDKKSESLLAIIAQNTSKANELTLRNMTYGGGQLAAAGISAVQMSGYRSSKSPQISASNDIVRGVEKLNRNQNMSNNLNFNFRRA